MSTKTCPYCAEDVRAEAIKCRYCGSFIGEKRTRNGRGQDWTRSNADRMIAGVCGGIAEIVGLPTAVVRLAFILGTIVSSGLGLVIYVVLAIVMPLDTTQRGRQSKRDAAESSVAPRDASIDRELGPDDPR